MSPPEAASPPPPKGGAASGLSITNAQAHERFCAAAREMHLDPANPWIGGYADYSWQHTRHLFDTVGVAGRQVLELGCNVGAGSIVLARLGAQVTAVDIDDAYLRLSALNAAAHGLRDEIRYARVETARLPFADHAFDLIVCCSVLEYVHAHDLPALQREIHRVLKPGGLIMVIATSSRLWPREVHSGRWGVNYLPRAIDRWLAPEVQRGVSPWRMRFGFGRGYIDIGVRDRGAAYLDAKRRMGVGSMRRRVLGWAAAALAPFGISAGLLTPSLSVTLRKPGQPID